MSNATTLRHWLAVLMKPLLRFPADAVVLSSVAIKRRIEDGIRQSSAFLENPGLSSKFYPFQQSESDFILRGDEWPATEWDANLPVPPPDFFEGYGETAKEYIESSRDHFENMYQIITRAGFSPTSQTKVLDFGCASGRLLRRFNETEPKIHGYGVDINARYILWCQQNLKPFHFSTCTTHPHLPFEDSTFDLVYSGSVFTHISDLADAWFLELKRIVKPGGLLYLTVHDEAAIDALKNDHPDFFLTKMVQAFDDKNQITNQAFKMFTLRRSPRDAMVFYHSEYLKERWGSEVQWVSHHKKAYGYQSAVVLKKSESK